tara:strand:- start:184 stop:399 length:216 start_codon:yes stop_codon:yes gene_type:complete
MNNIKRSISKNLFIKQESEYPNKNDKKNKLDTINRKSNKEDTNLRLVEEIEELGFIPAINKKNNSNVHNTI